MEPPYHGGVGACAGRMQGTNCIKRRTTEGRSTHILRSVASMIGHVVRVLAGMRDVCCWWVLWGPQAIEADPQEPSYYSNRAAASMMLLNYDNVGGHTRGSLSLPVAPPAGTHELG